MKSGNQTALLLFTQSADVEAERKPLVSGKKKLNYKLLSLLIHNTRKTAAAAGLPFFETDNLQQTGNSFGERISNAVAAVFAMGFENVIIIGNDCPQLSASLLQTAARQMLTHKLVLGPDHRGGVYLIGISKSIFNKSNFENKQWQAGGLLNDLTSLCSEMSCFLLPSLKDVNTFEDLKRVTDYLPAFHTIKAFVSSFLASFFSRQIFSAACFNSRISFLFGLRAPPVF